MTYKLKFLPVAKKEWDSLNKAVQMVFKKKLAQRLESPEILKDRLHGELKDCYKIKLLKWGYRLVYKVNKHEVTVLVVAVGKRDKQFVYQQAQKRM